MFRSIYHLNTPFFGIFALPVSHEGRLHAVEGYPS